MKKEKIKDFNNKYKVKFINSNITYQPQCGRLLFIDKYGNFIENKRKCLYFKQK